MQEHLFEVFSFEREISAHKVADRQGISLKYLEQIVAALAKNGYIEGVHGKGGGYRLVKAPEDCRVGDILRLTEGDLAPVACLECDAKPCERVDGCKTYPICGRSSIGWSTSILTGRPWRIF